MTKLCVGSKEGLECVDVCPQQGREACISSSLGKEAAIRVKIMASFTMTIDMLLLDQLLPMKFQAQ